MHLFTPNICVRNLILYFSVTHNNYSKNYFTLITRFDTMYPLAKKYLSHHKLF